MGPSIEYQFVMAQLKAGFPLETWMVFLGSWLMPSAALLVGHASHEKTAKQHETVRQKRLMSSGDVTPFQLA